MTYKGGGDGLQSNGRGDESGFDALLWCGEARGQRGDSNRRRVVQLQRAAATRHTNRRTAGDGEVSYYQSPAAQQSTGETGER